MTPKIFRVPLNTSGSDKATNVKFGRTIQRDSLSISPLLFVLKRGVAMSRDSQLFRVPPNISGMGKAMNVLINLLIKQEVLNMRSLTNKTANIKYKNLSVYKTV